MVLYKKIIVLSGAVSGLVKISRLGEHEEVEISSGERFASGHLALCQGTQAIAMIKLTGTASYSLRSSADYNQPIFAAMMDGGGELMCYGASQGAGDIVAYLPLIEQQLSRVVASERLSFEQLNGDNDTLSGITVSNDDINIVDLGNQSSINGSGNAATAQSANDPQMSGAGGSAIRYVGSQLSDAEIHGSGALNINIEGLAVDSVNGAENSLNNSSQSISLEQSDNTMAFYNDKSMPFVDILAADSGDDELFYNKVSAQIDELFSLYPHDYELEELVHSSQWVRIDYDDNTYYIVGIIYDEEMPQFICYGAPSELKDSAGNICAGCEWLPLDRNNPLERGYWVLYQSALDGELMVG